MGEQGWTATGVIEAAPESVSRAMLSVEEGSISDTNAPLLQALPGAGRLLRSATLVGGPATFTVHYGRLPGGTVAVDRDRGRFSFQGGYKFRAEYQFTPHPKGTLLTYRAINVAPAAHQRRLAVRFQFWLGGHLKIGLRGALRRIGRLLDCPAYPGT
jgi:hypothetical protein